MSYTADLIHIIWEGPHTLEEIKKLNEDHDYGIYQICGSHPVYGLNTILYIGKATKQTFSNRVGQEDWEYTWDQQFNCVQVYVGRIGGGKTPSDSVWDEKIEIAEKMLICSHSPANNQHMYFGEVFDSGTERFFKTHILNHGSRNLLLPEVSGAFWTERFKGIEKEVYKYANP